MSIECGEELLGLIKDEYKQRTGESNTSNIKLPTNFDYCIDNKILYLTIKNVEANMQDDDGAFDSWALAIKNWVSKIDKIVLKWERPKENSNPHYQRLLYRVKKATCIYHEWLEVEENSKPLLDDLLIKPGNKYVVNVPLGEAQENATNCEARIERLFVRELNDFLASTINMDNSELYNQLPVGLFENSISNNNPIFPSGNAMIDIWGVDIKNKQLHIFELKQPDQIPLGIYSELLFYSMFEKDIIDGNFIYKDRSKIKCFRGICRFLDSERKSIKAHFLATELHPLIDNNMIKLINSSLKEPYDIEIDYIKYHIDVECKKEF